MYKVSMIEQLCHYECIVGGCPPRCSADGVLFELHEECRVFLLRDSETYCILIINHFGFSIAEEVPVLLLIEMLD
jgi:hypothetical protein